VYSEPNRNAAFRWLNTANALGNVLSCRGSEAQVGLIRQASSTAMRATVGKFVVLKHARGGAVGMISEISANVGSQFNQGDYNAVAKVDLMGEIVIAEDGKFRFERGVRGYPAIGDDVELLGKDNLHLIYSSFEGRAMNIGEVQEDGGVPAYVDANGLVSRHFAVLGSTGVGKSSGTAVILNELMATRPEVRILMLDVHNEYGNSFGAKATIIDADTLKLPFWLFNFEEFTDAIYGGRPPVVEELDILGELIPIAKGSYSSFKSGAERSILTKRHPRQSAYTVDTPAPYMIQDLIALIDDRMGKLENRATRMVHHRLMARIEAIRNDPRYAFMFENANVGGDTMAAVLGQLFSVNASNNGIALLKLACFPGEVVDAVVCVVLRLAFEFGLWSDGGAPLLIVCEEAHRFAAADHTIGFAPARRALSRIAKEGRKYGVHLGLITQRPAELDPTIVSQCGSLFMMRMANERDHTLLRSAVADAASNLLSFVPSLGTGEVVGVGEAMPLPLRFAFRRLPRERLPMSDHLQETAAAAEAEDRGVVVERVIERWRRATSTPLNAAQETPAAQPAAPAEPGGQSALARGLQAALSTESGILTRNRSI
jgi:DNA helicase HerA-like ATPase